MESLVRTARTTGALYLALAVTGMFGFLLIRPRIFDADEPGSTLANLLAHESLARTGVLLELGVVVAQVLAALWFYRLFRSVDELAASAIAVFGMVNAMAILGSAAMLASALEVATGASLGGDQASTVALLYVVSEQFWGVGNVFFGLWLIPMGVAVLRSGWMPALLGRVLVVGGVGYVLSAVVTYAAPDAGALADVLVVPATIGELWMLGHLLVLGVRPRVGSGTGSVGPVGLEPTTSGLKVRRSTN